MKIANIGREILHIFLATWGTSIKFSGKMWIMMNLKVKKKTGFHPLFWRYTFQKTTGGWVKLIPPEVLGLSEN